jgi:hypothetical protein
MAPLMGQAMNELARVEARALAALPGPMRVDIVETPDEYRLVADLPGVAARDLKVDVGADNVLRIVADKTDAFEQDETRVRIACATGRTPGDTALTSRPDLMSAPHRTVSCRAGSRSTAASARRAASGATCSCRPTRTRTPSARASSTGS